MVSMARSRNSSRMASFSQLVDDDRVGDRVDLGHPGVAPIEQVDGLGHGGQGVGVVRTELVGARQQLFDLRLEVCHGRGRR